MQAVGTDRATSTHPAKADRVSAITRGWNEGKKNTGQVNAPVNPPANNPTTPPTTNPPSNSGNNNGTVDPTTDPNKDPSWIGLTIQSNKAETVLLSDDGRNFQKADIKANEPFYFKFEIYSYGWLRLPYYNGYRTFKLQHGKDYSILYNRRTRNWTVVEVPE